MVTTYNIGTPGATNPEKEKFIASAASKAYQGPSVVDYLNLSGVPSDQASRVKMGEGYGISGIQGSNNAAGNTMLLNYLRNNRETGSAPLGSTGGTTPSGAVVDASGKLQSGPTNTLTDEDSAFSDYLKSLTSTPEDEAATSYLNNLTTQSKLDYEKALQSGETLGFATGEAGRVDRQNAILLEGAARNVEARGTLAGNRSTIAKARLDYETGKLTRAAEAKKASIKAPFELSPGQERYEYDPITGKPIKVASVPPTPKKDKKLTEGEKRKIMTDDVNEAVRQLGQIVKVKGFRGVSIDDYNEMRAYLQKEYGYEGVKELDSAMEVLGLSVDKKFAEKDAALKK